MNLSYLMIKRNPFVETPYNKQFKLILIDIDETLLTHSQKITLKTKNLIKKLQKKIIISLISSRSRTSAFKIIEELNLKSHHILENGAIIINQDFNPIYKVYIQKAVLKKLYKVLTNNNLIFNACADGYTEYFENIKDLKTLPFQNVTRVSVVHLHRNQLVKIENLLKIIDKINYHKVLDNSSSSSKWNIDITSNLANKESALKFLCNLIKIDESQTIGIGDGYNDLPFIKNVAFKIAMGNGVKELKEIADVICPPVDKDGISQALEMININI